MSIIQVCLFWYRILDAEQRLNIWQGPFGFLSDSDSYPIRQIVVRPFARQAPHLVSKFGHRPYGYMSKFFSRAVWSLHLDQHVIFLALREPHIEGGNPPLSRRRQSSSINLPGPGILSGIKAFCHLSVLFSSHNSMGIQYMQTSAPGVFLWHAR